MHVSVVEHGSIVDLDVTVVMRMSMTVMVVM